VREVELMMGICIFIMGLCIGSFLNVCIYRIPRDESIAFPPSRCTNCSMKLKPYDIIPVISYIILGGKCRGCKEKISVKYPAVELFTGILFYIIYMKFGLTIISLKFIVMVAFLIVIAGIDFSTQDVYSVTTFPCIAAGVVLLLVEKFYFNYSIGTYLTGFALGSGLIAFIVFLTGGMGEGDIEIAAICGLFLGFKNTLVTLMFSFIVAAIYGVLLIVFKKKTRKDAIPFGPFLFIGALIALMFGEGVVNSYLGYFI